jgi:ATP-dependent Lon protease
LISSHFISESGVRSLEKHIEKLARKVAFEAVEKVELSNPDTVTNETVTDAEVVEVIMEIGSHKIVNTETADDHKQNDSSSPKIILPEPLNIVVEDVDLEKYLGKAKFAQVIQSGYLN